MEEERGHDMVHIGYDSKADDRRKKLGLLYEGDLFHVLADIPVVLPVVLLILVKVLFIKKNLSFLPSL